METTIYYLRFRYNMGYKDNGKEDGNYRGYRDCIGIIGYI